MRTFQISAEMIEPVHETLLSMIQKLLIHIWNKQKLPDKWKESITVPIHKKGDKIECNNCRGISVLSATYKMPLNILL
jgi:hypothetical protein